jgi:hypothetical protein
MYATGDPEIQSATLGSAPGRFNSILCDDIDADGNYEIVYGNYEGYLTILEYRGFDYHLEWRSVSLGTRLWGLALADVDGDGILEIIVGNGEGIVQIFDARSHKSEWRSPQLMRDAHGIATTDINRDGKIEIIVGTGYKTDVGWGSLYILEPHASQPIQKIATFDSRLRAIAVDDVDSDGTAEIIVGSGVSLGDTAGEGYIRIFDSHTYTLEWQSPNLGGDAVAVQVKDLDVDGITDIIVCTGYRYTAGKVHVINYDKSLGSYITKYTIEDIGAKPYGLAVGDIDGDDLSELIIGTQAGYIHVFDGISRQLKWKSHLLGIDVLGICVADVDKDGTTEIIAAQGGYKGKGDFTSAYTAGHIYIINGKTYEFEATLGEIDYFGYLLEALVVILIIMIIIQLNIYTSIRKKHRKQQRKHAEIGEKKR